MSFNSNENRQLLLQLFKNNPIHLNHPDFFIASFNNIMNNIMTRQDTFISLIGMNKAVIKEISNLAVQQPKQEKKLTKSEIFKNRLSSHEKNFAETINIKKPEEIDFSDNIEENEMKDIDQTMLQRERELKEIMGSYNTNNASKWLETKETREKPTILKIKNDDDIKIDTIDLEKKVKKQVRFEITEKKTESIQNLFGKLKKITDKTSKSNNSSDDISFIKEQLKNIVLKQDMIIEKLDRLFITKN